MKKQTATEWLFEQLWETPKDKFDWNALLKQAKEIEKQQIIEARVKKPLDTEWLEAEQYYIETYNK